MNIPTNPRDLQTQARREALYLVIRETYQKYFRRKIQLGQLEETAFYEGDFAEIAAELYNPKPTDNDKWCMITINPHEDYLSDLENVVSRILNYKNFIPKEYAQWSLEQRSDDPEHPRGYHAHIVFPNLHGIPKSQLISRSFNSLKRGFDGAERQSIDIKFIPEDNAIKYVNTYKHCDKELGLGPQQ